MKKLVSRFAIGAAALGALAGAAYGKSLSAPLVPSITVNTPTGTLLTLKTSELALLPQSTVTLTVDGSPVLERGPTLQSLLTYAGVAYNNTACSNDELRWWIEVTNAQAQAAVLTAGEIDPNFGNRPAILSISENGNFLTGSGPTLIVPNDSGARNLKHVSVVTVGRATPELQSTTPACNTTSQVQAPPVGSLMFNGDVAKPQTLGWNDLSTLSQVFQNDNFFQGANPRSVTEQGPSLVTLLNLVQPKFLACDPNDKLRFYVEISSSQDGFAVLESYAEFDSQLDSNNAIMSLNENGSSLQSAGPRSTSPGDVRGGRYVSGGAVITVFRAPTEMRIPSCAKARR